jgi:hypothetical protein
MPGFLADLRRLPDEHCKMFAAAVHELLRPALDVGAHTGAAPWPRALRIHRTGYGLAITTSITIDEPKTVASCRPAAIGLL